MSNEAEFYERLIELVDAQDVDDALQMGLELCFEMLGATVGHLRFTDRLGDWQATLPEPSDKPIWSETVIQRALTSGEPVMTDSITSGGIDRTQSMRNLKIEAVFAVPLIPRPGDAPVGVLYLHRSMQGGGFTPEAVERAKKIARQVARFAPARSSTAIVDPTEIWRSQANVARIVGRSQACADVLWRIKLYALSPSSVLVTGESGVGKSLVAEALHANSPRTGPFVHFDCGTVSAEDFRSALFGVTGGTFTGVSAQIGHVSAAESGTLFLDEIGNLDRDAQGALLQLLDSGRYSPKGSTETRTANIRVITATNLDLEAEVRAGRFRDDLYQRLQLRIEVPPLRERREDIPLIADTLLERIAKDHGVPKPRVDQVAMATLQTDPWRGNVRELYRVLLNAFLAMLGGQMNKIELVHLGERFRDLEGALTWEAFLRLTKRKFILDALRRNGGVKTKAAEEMGIRRQRLHEWMKELGIDDDDY
jgi:DNA-binding NtrC family response regulator